MNRKIGLVLAYKGTNYGALLQAFATQHIIESLGFKTEIIDFMSNRGFSICNFFQRGYLRYRIGKIGDKMRKTYVPNNINFIENQKERKEIANEFRKRKLHGIVKIEGLKNLRNHSKKYMGVIIGSDQKWFPGACFSSINSLRFVPDGVRRISYATSLGVSEYPHYCWSSSRKMWLGIDCLSVREQQGAEIVKEICGPINVSVVLDPTYLITKDEWCHLVPPQIMNEQKYVFGFFLGNNTESKLCARKFADANNLQLVSLFSNESFNDFDLTYADKLVSGVTPEGFVNWIRGAEYVFTDSFHGLAFSVINEKQFFVFYRKREDVSQSRNSRIDNILKTLNLENRLICNNNIDWFSCKMDNINYDEVKTILEQKRDESYDFLKKSLMF